MARLLLLALKVHRILKREQFGSTTFLWEVEAPAVARAARPGHFLMVRVDATGERIPLTVADFDESRGTVTVVIQAVGKTTRRMMELPEGAWILDFVGPLGVPSHIAPRELVVLVGGGLGVAPVFPQLRAYKEHGSRTISIIGFRSRDLVLWEDRFRRFSDECHVTTDDGSHGSRGLVTDVLRKVLAERAGVSLVVAIGPLKMMRACAELTRPLAIPTLVSLNSIMVDGTGMCGSCRVSIDGIMRFACVDGPDFDGHKVDYDELMLRQKRFEREERGAMERYARERVVVNLASGGRPSELRSEPSRPSTSPALGGESHSLWDLPEACRFQDRPAAPEPFPPLGPGAPRVVKTIRTVAPAKTPMPELPADVRARNFLEVNLGYSLDQAMAEANRCLGCKKARCVSGCPVGIDIPAFITAIARRDLRESYRILKTSNMLPAVCGRVCPQETQCEATCIIGAKLEPVAIGRLERFVADFAAGRGWDETPEIAPAGLRVAVIGSGPAGLACAGDLVRRGVGVTIFEALHVAGGVLKYGIPEFRLPNSVIDAEIEVLRRMGVEFELDAVIGKLYTVRQILDEMGYQSVFIGTGAGSPKFMNIPGESLNGVFSANEFLTRVNLMHGNDTPLYDTPVGMGRRVAVVGAGNTAMDAARVALRIGAEEVTIVYRRSQRESPARVEELHHAMDEGVRFRWLTNPVRILGSESGWVSGMVCVEMELGDPDESGRRRPIPRPDSETVLGVDTVICALGTTANPILAQTTPGLALNRWGYIGADGETGATSLPGIYAGGDIVTGSATVILAMGAGRRAAAGILRYLRLDSPSPVAVLAAT